MSKEQDDFEQNYLISKGQNPKATFYLKSLRKKGGYRHKEINFEYIKYLQTR